MLLGACQGGSQKEASAAAGAVAVTPVAAVPASVPAAVPSEGVPSEGELPPQRAGVCAELHASLGSGGKGLRYFAEVTPQQQGAPMLWAEVRSRKEADERSPEGTAGELWTVAEREGWRLAVLSEGSASARELCFRPDGSLEPTARHVPPAVTQLSDLPFASLLVPAR